MFSDQVLALSLEPRHEGTLESPTNQGLVGMPGEGEFAWFRLNIGNGTVRQARWQTYTCPASRACCELLCRISTDEKVEKCLSVSAQDLIVLLRGLPEGKVHLAKLAVNALRSALASGESAAEASG